MCVKRIRNHKMDYSNFKVADFYYRKCSNGRNTYETTKYFLNNRLP